MVIASTEQHPGLNAISSGAARFPASLRNRTPASERLRPVALAFGRPETIGVSHPTLPCGARVFVTYHGQTVLVQVVDRGPFVPGRQFDLTDALARRLGLRGVQEIHWAYARSA